MLPGMALRALASLLAPPLCWGCRRPVGAREPLCRSCRGTLRWLEPAAQAIEGIETWAPLAYEGAARELVRAIKYRAAEGLAGAMAAQIAANAPPGFAGATLAPPEFAGGTPAPPEFAGATLVPVPLHPARLRRRGYNQAARLAQALSRRTGLALADCLQRGALGAPQVGRRRSERVSGAMGVRLADGARVPARVLLVDDVVTTGATIAACARVLRDGGAAEVRAVAYARTLAR
jgi:ComF family protein